MQKQIINNNIIKEQTLIKSSINVDLMEKKLADLGLRSSRIDIFSTRLSGALSPAMSAKELVEKIVKTALEVEFGATFTSNKGFGKMVKTIADSIVTNPELRRQALSIASLYITDNIKNKMGAKPS